VLVVLMLSCVSKGTHELVEVQLDATRTALSARNASCYTDISDRDQRLREQEEVITVLRTQNSTLAEHFEAQRLELESTRADLAAGIMPTNVARVQAALAVLADEEQEVAGRVAHFNTWQERLGGLVAEEKVAVVQDGGDVLVRIPTVQIFNEGRVSVSPRGEVLLATLAEAMTDVRRDHLLVTAHTDNTPYHSAAHESNWELGFAQAMTVVRTLQTQDGRGQIVAASAAGTMPLVAGGDEDASRVNRRIEIRIRPE
jgi:flagellar motor protein MotB